MQVKFECEYFTISLLNKLPKTDVYIIDNNSNNSVLGTIKWYGAWRQYCFFPHPGCVFSKGCLNEIRDFIEILMKKHRAKQKIEKGLHNKIEGKYHLKDKK